MPCLFCSRVNVYVEDVFGVNRLLITIFPQRNNCILKVGSKICIKCYGMINQLEKFVKNFRDVEYNEPDCCNFCGSEQVFQSSIEPIHEAVKTSKLWTKETTPLCCGACYWQIDQMTQIKNKLETITFTLKFLLLNMGACRHF